MIIGYLTILFCVFIMIYMCTRQEFKPTQITPPIKIIIKKDKVVKSKPAKDPSFEEAKSTLVMMGFKATEAKKMLEGLSGSPDDMVTKAMEQIEV